MDSFVEANQSILELNKKAYEDFLLYNFYYSYNNDMNNFWSENVFYLSYIYQYITEKILPLEASHFSDDIQFAKYILTHRLKSYIYELLDKLQMNPNDSDANYELSKFIDVQNQYLHIVDFDRDSDGVIIDFNINLDNHPYFIKEFRDIFTDPFFIRINDNTIRIPGVTTRRGTTIYGPPVGIHGNSREYQALKAKNKALFNKLDSVFQNNKSGGTKNKRRFIKGNKSKKGNKGKKSNKSKKSDKSKNSNKSKKSKKRINN